MKTAMAMEFKAHPPAEFKKLLEEWARDFEKLKAVVHQKTTVSEDIAVVEAQTLQEAVKAATAAQTISMEALLHRFISNSGDPTFSETFQEIRIEAATLSGARNETTRKAAKAREAAKMVASKQGLAKDPAALSAANQLFADYEDMRTRIQTRLAKFIQNPLADYQKHANLSTAATLMNNVYASGILAGTPGVPGLIGAKTTKVQPDDNVFAGGRISDASAYLKDYPGLQWPHGAPAANALARVEFPALRPGMVVPILRFQLGIIGFDQLAKPAAYYVVITNNIDGRIRLVLEHQADDGATQYPQCLLFTKAGNMDAKRPLIVFTDTGVRTMLMEHIADSLRKKYSPLIGPDTTGTQRNDGGGAHGTGSAKPNCAHRKRSSPSGAQCTIMTAKSWQRLPMQQPNSS